MSATSKKQPTRTRVAIYARVSTDGQTVENQLRELRAVAKRHDWHVVGEFLETFLEFPPRQTPGSFTIDQVMKMLNPKSGQ